MGQKKKRRFTRPSREEMRKFRKLLGPAIVKRYTPGQLTALYYDMHAAARLLLELWIAKKGEMNDSSGCADGSSHARS
jgi:hypothetical protein